MTSQQIVVGLDVGGANLKYCCSNGVAHWRTFPMWRQPDELEPAIASDLSMMRGDTGRIDQLAVTMTGELADCFNDRAEGVRHIVTHTQRAARRLGIERVRFYGVDGQFRNAVEATEHVDLVAAANWHALASFVAESITGRAILVDVGTTTTDIIPLSKGRVATAAKTDFDRLQEGSLVYVGCRRTPVCALLNQLTFGNTKVNVMNEVFATIDDARLLLGNVPEDSGDCDTADGKPRIVAHAANRLARMIGLDHRNCSFEQVKQLAVQVTDAATQRIETSLQRFDATAQLYLSGHGEDLVAPSRARNAIALKDQLGPSAVRCAPSYAVAHLGRNRDTQPHPLRSH